MNFFKFPDLTNFFANGNVALQVNIYILEKGGLGSH
jgi:hypothetical protein